MLMIPVSVTKEHKIKQDSLARRFFKQWDIQLMVIPALLFVFVFSYIPMYGVLMAFQDYSIYKGFLHSPGSVQAF